MIEKVYFIITNKCNKRCEFCYVYNNNVPEVSSIDTLRYIVNNNYVKHLIIIGGEPTLDVVELNKVIDEFDKKVGSILITTNGFNISPDLLSRIKSNVRLQISIYEFEDITKENIIINDNILYHILVSENNLDLCDSVLRLFNNMSCKNLWVSFDRSLVVNDRIMETIHIWLFNKLLLKEYFRDNNYVGKNCSAVRGSLITIVGDIPVRDCYERTCTKTNMELSIKCMSCDNEFCDACVCDDIGVDRESMCTLFDLIKTFYLMEV